MNNPFAEQSQMDEMCGGLNLTRTQRLYAFGGCFVIGFVVSFLATLSLFTQQFVSFAILYTIGNIIALASTGFLIGFTTQLKKMFDKTRRTAAAVFLTMMSLTLVLGLWLQSGPLTLLLVILQSCSLFWYSLSYIPFARDGVKSFFGRWF